MLYTIPAFQNPAGVTIPADRRQRIAELAAEYDFIVREDDPYGDVRFRGEKIPPIKLFDKADKVIMMNSFSKTLAPGIRVGACVAPVEIAQKLEVIKQGCKPMLYSSKIFLETIWSERTKKSTPVWLAHYVGETTYEGEYAIWQQSAYGRIPGIAGDVDMNIQYLNKEIG